MSKTGRHITILGMGPSARERCHDILRYIPEESEIWGLNNGYLTFPTVRDGKRFSRMFELHAWDYLRKWSPGKASNGEEIDHFANLERLGCEVITGQHLPLIQKQTRIDWEAVFKHFGRPVYFLGSPSIMLALALYEHDSGATVRQIDSWGIDTSDPSHAQQRASWAYWIARAMERGIQLGGTSTVFMREHENDAGLQGIRELIEERLATGRQAGVTTDYVVATFATQGKYEELASRLHAQCVQLGIKADVTVEAPPEGTKSVRDWACRQKPRVIRAALEKHKRPVLFIDADDELLAMPSFPVCDVGYILNPEKKVIATHLEVASFGYYEPTPAAFAWLDDWQAEIDRGTPDHRAYQCTYTRFVGTRQHPGTFADVTAYVRGAIRQNPSPQGYRPQTTLT